MGIFGKSATVDPKDQVSNRFQTIVQHVVLITHDVLFCCWGVGQTVDVDHTQRDV